MLGRRAMIGEVVGTAVGGGGGGDGDAGCGWAARALSSHSCRVLWSTGQTSADLSCADMVGVDCGTILLSFVWKGMNGLINLTCNFDKV